MAADIKLYHLRNRILNGPDNQRLLNEKRHSQPSEKGANLVEELTRSLNPSSSVQNASRFHTSLHDRAGQAAKQSR